ncbi:hypothetical protein DIPPA_02055 [Diplonema papillatum]|nr:hypothetical protein DIPPA_02055 [Diplonema papillatum]
MVQPPCTSPRNHLHANDRWTVVPPTTRGLLWVLNSASPHAALRRKLLRLQQKIEAAGGSWPKRRSHSAGEVAFAPRAPCTPLHQPRPASSQHHPPQAEGEGEGKRKKVGSVSSRLYSGAPARHVKAGASNRYDSSPVALWSGALRCGSVDPWGQDDCAKACHRTSADESFAERFYAQRLKRQKHVAEAAVARFAPPCCGKKLNASSTRAIAHRLCVADTALRRQRHEKALAAL